MTSARSLLQERFVPYHAEVEGIGQRIADANPDDYGRQQLRVVPDYINSGQEFDVVRLSSDPGVVAKLPYESTSRGFTVDEIMQDHTEAYIRGLGGAGLEQIVAYNEQIPAILCEHVPGPLFVDLSEDSKARLQPWHYMRLLATFRTMQDRRLKVDFGVRNIIFRYSQDFTIIDYKAGDQSLSDVAATFAHEILLYDIPNGSWVPEYALMFRELCDRELGPETTVAISQKWETQGLFF